MRLVLSEMFVTGQSIYIWNQPHLRVSASRILHGVFLKAFSRAFDIGGLFLTLHDGPKFYFDSVADKRN